ncbi:MAG TPA: DUF397 domain-containing protein [Pseudonocardiaceae bacterium]|jgi:hypothetical protein|nr:DUF397 domain-containing protein [Pseudonocardiaceae bacterium]
MARRWRKSRRSGGNGGACVELAHTLDQVRDSKNPNGPVLVVPLGAFLNALKQGHLPQ